jgi:signal transduction histidine kinase
MKILFSLVLLFLFSFYGAAQKTETIKQKIGKTADLKKQVDLYNELSLAEYHANINTAIPTAEKNIARAKVLNFKAGQVGALLTLVYVSEKRSSKRFQEDKLNEALKIATDLKSDSLIADCNLAFSQQYFATADYDKSIAYGLQSLKISERTNNKRGVIRAKSKLAQVYQMMENMPKAQEMLEEILALPDAIKYGYNVTLHTLANVYGMQGKYKEALAIDEKGLRYCDSMDLPFSKTAFYDNMGNCYMYSGNFEKAKQFFNISLQIDSSANEYRLMSDTYLNLGQLHMMSKKESAAIYYLNRAIQLSKQVSYKEATASAYKILSEIYQRNGLLDSSISNLKKHYLYRDSIRNINSENKISELQTIYDTEKKENEIQSQKLVLNNQRTGIIVLTAALGILSLLALLVYRRKQHQSKIELQKEIIQQQRLATAAIILAEENERNRIGTDLHDGVGQMVSAAKMNLSVLDSDINFANPMQKEKFNNVIDMLDESCVEIRTVSHQMMPIAMFDSGVSEAVQTFVQRIDKNLIAVDFYSDGISRLSKEKELILYRILQECINNVIKHAKASTLSISIHHTETETAVTVEDNGIGFDKSILKNDGIGLSNVQSRVNFLGGDIELDSRPGAGTLVSIHIPT